MDHFFEFLLRQGDNTLVLGHRTSEWCGTSPALEEDIALANTALDLIGQTQLWLGYAAEVEGTGRSANDLAFLRDVFHRIILDIAVFVCSCRPGPNSLGHRALTRIPLTASLTS